MSSHTGYQRLYRDVLSLHFRSNKKLELIKKNKKQTPLFSNAFSSSLKIAQEGKKKTK